MYNKFVSKVTLLGSLATENCGIKERVRLCARAEIILNFLFRRNIKSELFLFAAQPRPGTSGLTAARARGAICGQAQFSALQGQII